MAHDTIYSFFAVEKTGTGLTITVPNWRIEREIYALALWGMVAFFLFLCYGAWPLRNEGPVAFTDWLVFSLLVAGIVFLFGKIVWDSKGKRIVTVTGAGVCVEWFCLFRFRRREFSALRRLDRNVEKITANDKPPVLTLDVQLETAGNGVYHCPLPCLTEGEFNEISDTLRPFLSENDPARGENIRVENESGALRLLPVNMSGEAPWWVVMFSLLLVWGCALGISRLIEFVEMPFGFIPGLVFVAALGPVAVAFTPFLYRCCHRVCGMTLSPDRFEMETRLFGFPRVRRIDFPQYKGIRRTYRQMQTDRPVTWTVEILVGRKWFQLDTGSLHEQTELAATINDFLGIDEEKNLAEPKYCKFVRDEKGIRFPIDGGNVDVNGVMAIGVILVFLAFIAVLFSVSKASANALGIGLFVGTLGVIFGVLAWSAFGKCLIRPTESTLEIFRCYPFYRGKPFVVQRKEIDEIRILPPFADVADTPWGNRATGYAVEIVRNENRSVVLPCSSVEEQIWLVNALKKSLLLPQLVERL